MFEEEYEELLDSNVSFHDKNRFEVKLDVNVPLGRPRYRYAVDVFFFIPKSLGIGPDTYSKQQFYHDVQNYIRFKAPHIALARLIDPSNEFSPLFRYRQSLDLVRGGEAVEQHVGRLIHESKMLGCMLRSTVRDQVKHFLDQLKTAAKDPVGRQPQVLEVADSGVVMVKELRALLREVRSLKPRLHEAALPARVRDGYEFLDEYISLAAESFLTLLLEGIRDSPDPVRGSLAALDRAIQETLKSEIAYRREAGFRSVVTPGTENEELSHRRSVLKKFISNVLFLRMDISETHSWREFFFGLAAAIAMAFFVVVSFYVQARYQNHFILIGTVFTVGYVFKDRLKAWLQTFFSRNMSRWLPDHQVAIIDPEGGGTIGSFREAFTYQEPRQVPADVLQLRNIDNLTAVDEEGKPERILKYEKDVVLYANRIFERHRRLHSINDILRFSVASFLGRTDDPKEEMTHFNPESGELEKARVARVYPIEVIFRYRLYDGKGREDIQLERVRLVINRKGIKRLELVTPDKVPA